MPIPILLMTIFSNFINFKLCRKIHRFTEKGYFALGLDKVSEIIKYQGLLRSLKGVDYFSTMQQAINRYIEKQKLRDMLGYFIKYVGSSSYDARSAYTINSYAIRTRIMVR